MYGTFEAQIDDILEGKIYKTAEECMDSFGRFEKQTNAMKEYVDVLVERVKDLIANDKYK